MSLVLFLLSFSCYCSMWWIDKSAQTFLGFSFLQLEWRTEALRQGTSLESNSFTLINDEVTNFITCCTSFLDYRTADLPTILSSFYLFLSWKWKVALLISNVCVGGCRWSLVFKLLSRGLHSEILRSDTLLVLLWRWEVLLGGRKVRDAWW